MAARAGVQGRRDDLVLGSTLGRAAVRLLLLGSLHWRASLPARRAGGRMHRPPAGHAPIPSSSSSRSFAQRGSGALVVVIGPGLARGTAQIGHRPGAVRAAQDWSGPPARPRRGPSGADRAARRRRRGCRAHRRRRAGRSRGRRSRSRAAAAQGSACRGQRASRGPAGAAHSRRRSCARRPGAPAGSREPKGTMLTHEAFIWQYVSCIIEGEMAADDVVLLRRRSIICAARLIPRSGDPYRGNQHHHQRPASGRHSAAHRRTSDHVVFRPAVDLDCAVALATARPDRLSSLRKGYYGTSIMPVEVLREIQQRLPAVRLSNFYGQTEIAPLATVLQPQDSSARRVRPESPSLMSRPSGKSCQGRRATGEVGEIVHRSPQLLIGYFNDPARRRSLRGRVVPQRRSRDRR